MTLPANSPTISPLANTPTWLPALDKAAVNTDLAHVLSVYVACKNQNLPTVPLEGEFLQAETTTALFSETPDMNAKISGVFAKVETTLARAPVLYLSSLGFENVSMSANQQSYKIAAQYKGIAVEFNVFISDGKLCFVQAVSEVKNFLEANPTLLTKKDSILFSDTADYYQIVRHKEAAEQTNYMLDIGTLSVANFANLEAAFDKMVASGQVSTTTKAKWSDFNYNLNPDGTIDADILREDLYAAMGVAVGQFVRVGASPAKPESKEPVPETVAPVPAIIPETLPQLDYVAHLTQAGFTNVIVDLQGTSLQLIQGVYRGTVVQFALFDQYSVDIFEQAVQEVKSFLDAQKLPEGSKITPGASFGSYFIKTTHGTVDAGYSVPLGKLTAKNYARLDSAYDKLRLQLVLPQYVHADWGDFDYELTTKNTIYAVTKDAGIIEENGENGRYLVDERVMLMHPDDISSLKDEKNRDIGGPAKLEYYARLFDDDAPGPLNISDQDYADMVERVAHYPTNSYTRTVSADAVIDVVFMAALNADYQNDPKGPMKNKLGIVGLGIIGREHASMKALKLLMTVAADSPHEDLRSAARAEYKNFVFTDVKQLDPIFAIFTAKTKNTKLAIEALNVLAWVYHNTAKNEAITPRIESLRDEFKTSIDSQPAVFPNSVDGKQDWSIWMSAVNHFKKKIDADNPTVSQYGD